MLKTMVIWFWIYSYIHIYFEIVLKLHTWAVEYFIQIKSISCLLMPWLLASPGHQQPWYWWCGHDGSVSSLRTNFSYTYLLYVENVIRQTNSSFFNTLRRRQNGRHFADDTFKRIFLNENVEISIKISLKFVPKGRINNIPALVQVMAWHRPGHKPLTEPMVVRLLTHICVTRPQWVKKIIQLVKG